MKKRSERILRSERGFTLIELGVVLAIIAILTVIAYPTYNNIKKRAYIAEAKAIMQEIRVEVWAEFLESGKFADIASDAYDGEYWAFTGETKGSGNDATYTVTATPKAGNPAETQTLTFDTSGKIVQPN
ncbi:MAG: type IV pilin protein [Bacillota bacterium]|jgi:prepilin-type N-terminal cleavage/methylation domain-containing protein